MRITTDDEERVFRATDIASKRWVSGDPITWTPASARDRLLLQVGRDGSASTHRDAARIRTVREAHDEHVIVLHNLVLPSRTTCVFCGEPNPGSREHVVPRWAKEDGEAGITVASCRRCNNAFSELEGDVAVLSRQRPATLSQTERILMLAWAAKTIWVLGRALQIDPLLGWGDQIVASLLGHAPVRPVECDVEVDEAFSSVELAPSASFLKYSSPFLDRPWVLLRIRNLVTSIWLRRVDLSASTTTADGWRP